MIKKSQKNQMNEEKSPEEKQQEDAVTLPHQEEKSEEKSFEVVAGNETVEVEDVDWTSEEHSQACAALVSDTKEDFIRQSCDEETAEKILASEEKRQEISLELPEEAKTAESQ
jgi:hypothetical protein